VNDEPSDRLAERLAMVDSLRTRIDDAAVLDAMARVPRHRFVPPDEQDAAYDDAPVLLSHGQTVSQPFMVAKMAELAAVGPSVRVLDVGTGSGYAAAVFAAAGAEVVGVERIEALAASAADRLAPYGVAVHLGDGREGWPDGAPYDAIIVGAAARHVAPAWFRQLSPDGVLVTPIGPPDGVQELLRFTRQPWGEWKRERICAVAFVPLV